MTHIDPLARIVAMTDWERRSALCFIAGFNPFVLEKALNEMDRQRSAFANWNAGIESKTASTR